LISIGKDMPVPPKTVARIIGTDGINMRLDVESSGTFNIMLSPNSEYLVLVTAPGYFNHKDKINTQGIRASRQFNLNINLKTIELPLFFENIKFEGGSWELNAATKKEIDKVVLILKNNPSIKIDIISHTDARGDETESTELSRKRSEVIKQYIVSQEIATDRLATIGLGSKQPLKVDQNLAKKYNFLKLGDELNEDFIKRLMQRDQPTARNLNNRVEFSVRNE
jgi:peptidoglycan-associated lipoprotein